MTRAHHVCRIHGDYYNDHPLARTCPTCKRERERARQREISHERRAKTDVPGRGDNVFVIADPTEDFDPGAMFPVLQFQHDLAAGNWPAGMLIRRGEVISRVADKRLERVTNEQH